MVSIVNGLLKYRLEKFKCIKDYFTNKKTNFLIIKKLNLTIYINFLYKRRNVDANIKKKN